MFESSSGESLLQRALAGLPADEQEELLAELDAVLACSGADPAEYPEIAELWLAGLWPPPDTSTDRRWAVPTGH